MQTMFMQLQNRRFVFTVLLLIFGVISAAVFVPNSASAAKEYCMCSYLSPAPNCVTPKSHSAYFTYNTNQTIYALQDFDVSISGPGQCEGSGLESYVQGGFLCSQSCQRMVCDSAPPSTCQPAGPLEFNTCRLDGKCYSFGDPFPSSYGPGLLFDANTCVQYKGQQFYSLTECNIKQTPTAPTSTKNSIDVNAFLTERYPVPPGYSGPLPECAFHGTCSDVNDLLQLGINVGRWIFGLLGTFALVMFVYGGFVWVLSAGNPERVKQGRNIVVAAVVGLIIAFGAYVLVGFLLNTLSVQQEFRAIQ